MSMTSEQREQVIHAIEVHREHLVEMKHSKIVRLAAYSECKKAVELGERILQQEKV